MGQGIAQMAAQAGAAVLVHDVAAGAADKACASIRAQWQKMLDKGRLSAAELDSLQQRLSAASNLSELAKSDLVIEAVVENTGVKQSLFAELEKLLSAEAVIASNTSSLSITALAAGMKHPGRFAGLHFFNPVALMKVALTVYRIPLDPGKMKQFDRFHKIYGRFIMEAADHGRKPYAINPKTAEEAQDEIAASTGRTDLFKEKS